MAVSIDRQVHIMEQGCIDILASLNLGKPHWSVTVKLLF